MAEKKLENSFWVIYLIVGILLAGYVCMIVKPYAAKRRKISAEIEAKSKELELFRKERGGISSEELIKSLEVELEDFQKKLAFLKEYLGNFEVRLPAEVTQKGLFLKEKMYQTERRLKEKAEIKGMLLPASLGFDKGVPKEEEVEDLLWELTAMEEVVGTLIESGMEALVSLKLKEAEKSQEAGLAYTKVPIEIKCQGKTRALLNFVHTLTQSDSPLIIEKMEVQKVLQKAEDLLEFTLTIQGISFVSE